MKKIFLAAAFTFVFIQAALCARTFIEGEDYTVDFQRKDENMAAVLHLNFIIATPSEQEAESALKEQLKIYAQIIESEEAAAALEAEAKEPEEKDIAAGEDESVIEEEEDKKYKNIIGSVWSRDPLNEEELIKVKFKEDAASYVYLGKTKTIVPFPAYIGFLKKEREEKKEREKAKAEAEAAVESPGNP